MQNHLANRARVLISLATLALGASPGQAQTRGNVTVQLPALHQFSMSTSAVVPNRGSIFLGGVARSSLAQNQAGLSWPDLGRRGPGRTSVAPSLSVSATIIDHNEIDRALLAAAARRRGALFDSEGRSVAAAPSGAPTFRENGWKGNGVGGNSWRSLEARARDGRNSLAPPHFRRPRK